MKYKTPLAERREAWLEDLETTDAPQCTSALTNGVGFCCLGRACEVMRQLEGEDALPRDGCKYGDDTQWLPARACEYFGLRPDGGPNDDGAPLDERPEFLTDMNDCHVPFTDIAAHVRKHFNEYFVTPLEKS